MKTKQAKATLTKVSSAKTTKAVTKKSVVRKSVKKAAGVVSERHIPVRAGAALVAASRKAKKARLDTMVVSGGQLMLVSPEGKRTTVKTIAPGVKVSAGTKITLR